MGKKKPPPAAATDPAPDPAPKPTSYRPAPDVYAALEAYRATHEYRPSYSAVIDRALRMYLRSKGYSDLPAEPPDE